jgi:hypothetical protein
VLTEKDLKEIEAADAELLEKQRARWRETSRRKYQRHREKIKAVNGLLREKSPGAGKQGSSGMVEPAERRGVQAARATGALRPRPGGHGAKIGH